MRTRARALGHHPGGVPAKVAAKDRYTLRCNHDVGTHQVWNEDSGWRKNYATHNAAVRAAQRINDEDHAGLDSKDSAKVAMLMVSSRIGIPLTDVHRVTGIGTSEAYNAIVAPGAPLVYRNVGNVQELDNARWSGYWNAHKGGFTVRKMEGDTQFTTDIEEAKRWGHPMRNEEGSPHLVEADITGLPVRFIGSNEPRTWRLSEDPEKMLPNMEPKVFYPDQGTGIGVVGDIPVSRIKRLWRLHSNKSGAIAKTYTSWADFNAEQEAAEARMSGGRTFYAAKATGSAFVKSPPLLYHYTSKLHLPMILESGFLKTVESNIDMFTSNAGPDVVWFTDTPSAVGIGITPGFKDAVEFTIECPPDAQWWPQWSRQQGIDEDWYETLARVAGGSPDRWWVVPRKVPSSAWLSVKVDGNIISTGSLKTAADVNYFHGTRYRIKAGTVMEGSKFGSNAGYGTPEPHVFFSTNAQVARNFADDAMGPESDLDAKPRVYLVEPIGAIHDDPDEDAKFGCFYSESARVIKEVTWASNMPYAYHLGTIKGKTAEADTAGVMVALVPEPQASQALMHASDSTVALKEQHITLAYLGSTEEAGGDAGRELLHRAVYDFSMRSGQDVLNGKANGWGVFNNPDEDEYVLVALWDIPGIAEFRAALMGSLQEHGVPLRTENHGFTPHSTMRYHEEPITTLPESPDPQPESTFTHVIISWGDDWSSVALPGALDKAARRVTARDGSEIFDPKDHPRGGNTKNPGEFSKAPDSHTKTLNIPPPPIAPKVEPKTDAEPKVKRKEPTGAVREKMISRGDLFHHFLPAGKYGEGDPRNEPEYEARSKHVETMSSRYDRVLDRSKWTDQDRDDDAKGLGGSTDELYDHKEDPDTGALDFYDKGRHQAHNKILQAFFDKATKGVPKGGKVIIMGGPSGAGKSTLIKHKGMIPGLETDAAGEPTNFAVINPDNFKDDVVVDMTKYPGLQPNELAAIKHEESSYLAKRATEMLMSRGYNVLLDVAASSEKQIATKYLMPGYTSGYHDYTYILVDGDMKNSLNNAGNRWKKTDPETGDRRWSGRFVSSRIVLGQSPTEKGYRSINAQAGVQIAQNPRIDRAFVYDPFDDTKGLQDMKAAVHEAIRRNPSLSGILRAEGVMKMAKETTKITDRIRAFAEGEVTEEELIKYLTHDVNYAKTVQCPYDKNTPEWYRWHDEGRPYTPGSFEEVTRARDTGLLDLGTYEKIYDVLVENAR